MLVVCTVKYRSLKQCLYVIMLVCICTAYIYGQSGSSVPKLVVCNNFLHLLHQSVHDLCTMIIQDQAVLLHIKFNDEEGRFHGTTEQLNQRGWTNLLVQ